MKYLIAGIVMFLPAMPDPSRPTLAARARNIEVVIQNTGHRTFAK